MALLLLRTKEAAWKRWLTEVLLFSIFDSCFTTAKKNCPISNLREMEKPDFLTFHLDVEQIIRNFFEWIMETPHQIVGKFANNSQNVFRKHLRNKNQIGSIIMKLLWEFLPWLRLAGSPWEWFCRELRRRLRSKSRRYFVRGDRKCAEEFRAKNEWRDAESEKWSEKKKSVKVEQKIFAVLRGNDTHFGEAELVDGIHDSLAMRSVHDDQGLKFVRGNRWSLIKFPKNIILQVFNCNFWRGMLYYLKDGNSGSVWIWAKPWSMLMELAPGMLGMLLSTGSLVA